jgi:hypothetical protein
MSYVEPRTEEKLVGTLLNFPELISKINGLSPDKFSTPELKNQFTTILKVYKRDKKYDMDSVSVEFMKKQDPAAILYASDLSAYGYTAALFESHLAIVMEKPFIPYYIRVGCDYFKVLRVKNRYGINRTELKAWKKSELTTDYGSDFAKSIMKYDSFIMTPDNINYKQVIGDSFNLYSPFAHTPAPGEWTWTKRLLEHVFGEQYDQGLRYMQILYRYPEKQTVILALVSVERQTGKTTFVNYLDMLFGENMIVVSPSNFTSDFNSYAKKNIVVIEETLFEKKLIIEKLKALATQKKLAYNEKFISVHSVDFYGKVILTSNYEDRFALIDKEEVRFFVRKLSAPIFKNHAIEDNLLKEIPAFLSHLNSLPPVDWSVSRSGFTPEELMNENLTAVVKESRHEISKELKLYVDDYFNTNDGVDSFQASAIDIKTRFFPNDSRNGIAYIMRALKDDLNMQPEDKVMQYFPFNGDRKTGRPYTFYRNV